MHDDNCFVTLTFSNENMPWDHSVCVRDLQLFMKRLRKHLGTRVRFFACGEYGEKGGRPHYHLILFGYDPQDKTPWRTTPSGYLVHRSATLEKLWPFGHVEVGTVTHQSAGYVARYCTKKINGADADAHYEYVVPDTGEIVIRRPEFAVMSRKPGIGQEWWDKYASDAFPSDFLIIDGRKVGVPDYYLRKLPDGERADIAQQRKVNGWARKSDSTPERLAVREEIQHRKADKLIRKLEQDP